MNKSILISEYQVYINENLNSDILKLALNPGIKTPFDFKELIEQIEAKKKCEKKLSTWFSTSNIYYPNKLNIEQTSSEITAKYKSNIVSGKSLIDITGGFGVDAYYFSKVIDEITHCEIASNLSEIVKHNYNQLEVKNIQTEATDGLEFLKTHNKKYDWIYVDPSRRNQQKGKVFYLNDCIPNVPKHLDILFNRCKNILIKTSPLLDISIGINELSNVKELHIVALNNDVKELLWVLEKDYIKSTQVKTINISKTGKEIFNFNLEEEHLTELNIELPLTYLYEPNSAILKSGAFNLIAKKLNIHKLHQHSHLYTSTELIEFPGRTFKTKQVLSYNKESLKQFKNTKANITIRNFPDSVANIRKKHKIKDGGDLYLFFTTNMNNERVVVVCNKII